MTMKKSLIALAVSSAVVAPASVQAAEAYGNVHAGWESTSTDGGGTSMIFNTTGDDANGGAQDTWESQFGFRASEDLGNGLTAGANLEFGLSTSSVGRGSMNEDTGVDMRHANVHLSGDFGEVRLGTQWGVLYTYSGWNHGRTVAHGYGGHYWFFNTASDQTTDPSALRIDNAYTYTFGGGGYSSDPFTFSVQIQAEDRSESGNDINDDGDFDDSFDVDVGTTTVETYEETAPVEDDEAIDAVILGGQGTFGDFTVNGTLLQENRTNGPEPTIFSLGGRWSSGPFYVGGTFYQADNDLGSNPDDDANDEPTAFLALAGMDFGNGYNGKVGFGQGDADRRDGDGDMMNFYVEGSKSLGNNTLIYAEFESAETEDTGEDSNGNTVDSEEQIFAVGMNYSF